MQKSYHSSISDFDHFIMEFAKFLPLPFFGVAANITVRLQLNGAGVHFYIV